MGRARWKLWLEVVSISLISFLVVLEEARRIGNPENPLLQGSYAFASAAFIAGINALVSVFVLKARKATANPWRPQAVSVERFAAWGLGGALIGVFLATAEVELALVILLGAVSITAATRFWLRSRDERRRRPSPRERAIDRTLCDETIGEEVRAQALRSAIGACRSAAETDAELASLLPLVLARPTGDLLDAAIFGILEKTRSEATEKLLLKMLDHEVAAVRAKAAHLLSWFGTSAAIEPLAKISDGNVDAAAAAIGRIRSRVEGEPGQLSLTAEPNDGRLSLAHTAGALSIASARRSET